GAGGPPARVQQGGGAAPGAPPLSPGRAPRAPAPPARWFAPPPPAARPPPAAPPRPSAIDARDRRVAPPPAPPAGPDRPRGAHLPLRGGARRSRGSWWCADRRARAF